VDEKDVKPIFDPLVDWLVENAPSIKTRYPGIWRPARPVGRLVRELLLSEELVHEFGEYFEGKSMEELEALAKSFSLCESIP
jgi:hypothetical protein